MKSSLGNEDPPCSALAGPERIANLDLARGLAVMGILVINVTTMAGPGLASETPDWHGHATMADWATFAGTYLLFEGKMRAMFATLFGASMVLFLSRGDPYQRAIGQARRLLWLAVFGYLHFLLFWWGDILFTYAIAGMFALAFAELPPDRLAKMGIGALVFVALIAAVEKAPILIAAHAVHDGTASTAQANLIAAWDEAQWSAASEKRAEYLMGFVEAIRFRLAEMPGFPFRLAGIAVFEAFPLMLVGMALAKSGFFTGGWSREDIARLARWGLAFGLAWYGAMLAYAFSQDFAVTTAAILPYRIGLLGRSAMALGYLALIVLAAPRALTSGIARRIAACGRMAFSNYLGSTVLMTFLFHGWGLGLGERTWGHAALMAFVLLGWIVMLAWSQPWLARFGIGPLEWLWRTLARNRAKG